MLIILRPRPILLEDCFPYRARWASSPGPVPECGPVPTAYICPPNSAHPASPPPSFLQHETSLPEEALPHRPREAPPLPPAAAAPLLTPAGPPARAGAMMSKKLRALVDHAFFAGAPPRGVDPAAAVWEASKLVF